MTIRKIDNPLNERFMAAFINNKIMRGNKKAMVLLAMLISAGAYAQDAAAPVAAAEPKVNSLWYVIIAVMIVLLFSIFILGNALIKLARHYVEVKKAGKLALVVLLMGIAGIANAQGAAAAAQPAVNAGFNMAKNWNMIMAGTVLLAELMAVIYLVIRIQGILSELAPAQTKEAKEFHLPNLMDKFNASVAVEHEKDVLLDHNYDGIQELDNALPPWWKYGFYLTIVWAFVYLVYYHMAGGPSSTQEYVAAMEEAKVAKEAYLLKNALNVDENTVKMLDENGIAEGQKLFTANCTPCHGAAGEGNSVGPNLTDNYWIHGGTIQDVFKTIKYGWPSLGMQSWQADFSPVQMQQLASFVKSLKGTNPANAKAPQGVLFDETGGATTAGADSTAVTADSTMVSTVDTGKAKAGL
jgi:cytochrome c oxidase cbb3-type subunit 3